MREICCIVGSHPKTRNAMDFNRTDCDIWIFNEATTQPWATRFDGVFQMHKEVIFKSEVNRNDPKHYEWLQQPGDYKIFMQDQHEDIPCSVKYPLEELCDKLLVGHFNRKYFTSSVCYAIALAIYQGYKQIELIGVEMETSTEYVHQRDGVTFWIGLAIGAGIKVILHSTSLMLSPLYGYDGDAKIPREYYLERIDFLSKQFAEKEAIAQEKEKELNRILADYIQFGGDQKPIVKAVQEHLTVCTNLGVVDGARQENERYLKKIDKMILESGDYVIVMQEYEQSINSLAKARNDAMGRINTLAFQIEDAFKRAGETKKKLLRITRMSKFEEVRKAWVLESMKMSVFIGAMQESVMMKNNLTQLIRMAGGEQAKEIIEAAVMEKVQG